jgi:hypothetical protein
MITPEEKAAEMQRMFLHIDCRTVVATGDRAIISVEGRPPFEFDWIAVMGEDGTEKLRFMEQYPYADTSHPRMADAAIGSDGTVVGLWLFHEGAYHEGTPVVELPMTRKRLYEVAMAWTANGTVQG